MKSGGGKAKGSAWEREISRKLTKWLTGQSKELYYYRSPNSGGLATMNFGNKALSGDIIALKFESSFFTSIFNIEAKNGYSAASFDKHLKSNKNDSLRKFWEQSMRDAKNSDKLPLVIFKKKGMPNPWIAFNDATLLKLKEYLKNCRMIELKWEDDFDSMCFMNFDDFLDIITPDIIKENFKWE